MAAFDTSGRLPLPNPPESWVRKAAAIFEGHKKSSVLQRIKVRLTFDSWVVPCPVGVRGGGAEEHRRLRFEAHGRFFDLRAERSKQGWDFVAQLVGEPEKSITLKYGRQTVCPDRNGIFQWSSARPPRTISLQSENQLLELPDLKWTKPTRKKRRSDS
jgi:hypothetical protein